MNSLQTEYKVATDKVKAINNRVAHRMKRFSHLLKTDAGIDRYYEIESGLELDFGLFDAQNEVRNIEVRLIEWGKGILLSEAVECQVQELELVFEESKRNIATKNKAVDLIMRIKV